MSTRQPRRRAKVTDLEATVTEPIICLWMLRMLVVLGAHREFFSAHGFRYDSVALTLGLGHWIDPQPHDFDVKAVKAEIRQLHQSAETESRHLRLPACLRNNVLRLSDLVGLSSTDCRILEFVVMLNNERALSDVTELLGVLSSAKDCRVLSVILALPESEISKSLSLKGILARSGLLSVGRLVDSLRSKLDLLSGEFAGLMIASDADTLTLLRGTVSVAGAAQLSLEDYGHVQPSLEILRPYLLYAAVTTKRGVNIFVHGAPGTGKTQLARTLAADLACELFEVAGEDTDGDAVDGKRRLRAFRTAQSFFAKRRALIAFDEAEDVFNDGHGLFGRKSTAQTRKSWINRMLEENAVPTIWLSNTIDGLDPAFIRRFDMVFELLSAGPLEGPWIDD